MWGKIFVVYFVVVLFVKKGILFYMIEFKLRGEVEFVYEEDVIICLGYNCWVFLFKVYCLSIFN